jgi:hypothetical protein
MSAMGLCGLWAGGWTEPAFAQAFHAEDAVKAAFVLRFTGYVEWPEQSVSGGRFRIAVLGASEIGQNMQVLAQGRTVMNRPVEVRRINSLRDARDAQVIFIGPDRRGSLRELLPQLAGRNVLVITDEEDALQSGSMINLRMAGQHVRFEVSLPAAREASLRISSELLALAVRVQK